MRRMLLMIEQHQLAGATCLPGGSRTLSVVALTALLLSIERPICPSLGFFFFLGKEYQFLDL